MGNVGRKDTKYLRTDANLKDGGKEEMTKKRMLLCIGITVFIMVVGLGISGVIVVSHLLRTDPRKAMLVHGPMPVSLAQARVSPINDIIGASGTTEEIERIVLTAKISQPVVSVKVRSLLTVTVGVPEP